MEHCACYWSSDAMYGQSLGFPEKCPACGRELNYGPVVLNKDCDTRFSGSKGQSFSIAFHPSEQKAAEKAFGDLVRIENGQVFARKGSDMKKFHARFHAMREAGQARLAAREAAGL